MGDKSAQLLSLYQALIEQVKDEYAKDNSLTTKDLLNSITTGKEFLKLKAAAGEEELALVEHFLKRDIVAYISEQNANDLSFSPTVLAAQNTFWHWLNEITDRSQVEWHELAQDLKNEGHYHDGEIISQGLLTCTKCGHQLSIEFPTVITECPECEWEEFTREPLAP